MGPWCKGCKPQSRAPGEHLYIQIGIFSDSSWQEESASICAYYCSVGTPTILVKKVRVLTHCTWVILQVMFGSFCEKTKIKKSKSGTQNSVAEQKNSTNPSKLQLKSLFVSHMPWWCLDHIELGPKKPPDTQNGGKQNTDKSGLYAT